MSNNQFQGQKDFNKGQNPKQNQKGNMGQKQQSNQDRKYPGNAPFDHNDQKNR